MTKKTIAWLGTGAMGVRMATQLLNAGFKLTVFNRTKEKCAPLAELGATIVDSPKAAAEGAALVISMVRDDEASKEVWLDEKTGALASGSDFLALEMSTLTAGWVSELQTHAKARAVRLVDAPVVGTRPQAETGTLVCLFGGDEAELGAYKEALDVMCKKVIPLGKSGQGASVKLAVNAYFAIQVAALSETSVALEAAGLEAKSALKLLAALPITSPALAGVAGLIDKDDYAPLFPVELVEKDLGYFLELASSAGRSAPIAAASQLSFEKAIGADLANENINAVFKSYQI